MAHTFAGRWFRVLWLPVLAGLLWLGLTLGLYSRAARVDEEHRLELERIRLSTVARQLLDARNWNAAHGGGLCAGERSRQAQSLAAAP